MLGGGKLSNFCGYVLHNRLDTPLFTVSSESLTEFSRKKIISVKQDAINFFIRQLVNWLQLVEIRNLSSNDKGIRDPVLRVGESGIRCVASRIYTVLPSSLFTFDHHPRRFQVQKEVSLRYSLRY